MLKKVTTPRWCWGKWLRGRQGPGRCTHHLASLTSPDFGQLRSGELIAVFCCQDADGSASLEIKSATSALTCNETNLILEWLH